MTSPIDVSSSPVRRPGDGQIGVDYQPGLNRQNPPGGLGPWNQINSGAITVEVSGPFFSGAFRSKVAAMVDDMKYTVTAQGLADVQQILDASIQFPTPYYETQIMIQRQANDWVVHDRGIVYGPWLEGTSSRNQTTSFKGYHAFRRAADELRRKAPALVEWVARRHIAGLA